MNDPTASRLKRPLYPILDELFRGDVYMKMPWRLKGGAEKISAGGPQ